MGFRHGLCETGQQAPVISGTNVVHLFKIRTVCNNKKKWPSWGTSSAKTTLLPYKLNGELTKIT